MNRPERLTDDELGHIQRCVNAATAGPWTSFVEVGESEREVREGAHAQPCCAFVIFNGCATL
jgi:hypothetical protein